MKVAEVITPWIWGVTNDDSNRPQLGGDYSLSKWEDVTAQPAANLPLIINMYVILVECSDAVLTDIEADGAYQVLWSETIDKAVI